MGNLENRVARLESAQANVSLQALSDAELSAHIATLPFKSSEQYGAIISLILRHGSAFPVIHDDPDWTTPATPCASVLLTMKEVQNDNA